MELNTFLLQLKNTPDTLAFSDTIAVIDSLYKYTPTSFKNGALTNEQGQNSGSCKLFSFAQMQNFSEEQTLACFGSYYRDDVLKHPAGIDHQNIRNFIKFGWQGIKFNGNALKLK